MAEVGESRTEIRETKTRVRARKRENGKGNHKRTKKRSYRKGLRRFESSWWLFPRSWRLLSAHLVEPVELLQALWSPERWKLQNPWSSDTCFLDAVSKSNAQDFLSWCLWVGPRNWWGLEVKIERLPGLDEDEKLVELISVATRKDWDFEVVDFGESLGCLFGLYPWGCRFW